MLLCQALELSSALWGAAQVHVDDGVLGGNIATSDTVRARRQGARLTRRQAAPTRGQEKGVPTRTLAVFRVSFTEELSPRRHPKKVYRHRNALMAQVVDTTDDDDPAARHGSGVPPPINEKHRRPLRRRHGPAWASVHVLSENEEKGPYESRVRCRFCGEEFMADTARIAKHVKGADQKTVVVEPYRSPLDEDPASGDPEVVHPLPLCYEDATPTYLAERKEAIQWIEHHDLLLFYSQFGFAITEDLRRAIRTSEEATRSACLYPSCGAIAHGRSRSVRRGGSRDGGGVGGPAIDRDVAAGGDGTR